MTDKTFDPTQSEVTIELKASASVIRNVAAKIREKMKTANFAERKKMANKPVITPANRPQPGRAIKNGHWYQLDEPSEGILDVCVTDAGLSILGAALAELTHPSAEYPPTPDKDPTDS